MAGLGWRRAAIALCAGLALALVQAPVCWGWMAVFVFPVLFRLTEGADTRSAARIGWLAGLGYFAAALHWIVEPFLVDPERHLWMAPFALVFMAGGLALFWAGAFALAAQARVRGVALAVVLACLFTLAEMARSYVLTGFPWALLAYGWIGTPVAQALALIGPHGLGFALVLAALLLGTRRPVPVMLSLAVGIGLWAYGWQALRAPEPERAGPAVRVRIVQPNAPQHLKWHPDHIWRFEERLLSLSRDATAPPPDLVLWPETAVVHLLGEREDFQAAATAGLGAPLILGMRRRAVDGAQSRWYNTLAALGPGGELLARYDKHHLTPFGEYVPLAAWLARLGLPRLTGLTEMGFSAGPGPRTLALPGLPRILPLICYEGIFPQHLSVKGEKPEVIVQITNDAWFGTFAGPQQHLAQIRARAIERGLPVVRAANTGISAIIDARGRVRASLDLGRAGIVEGEIPPPGRSTPYAASTDLPTFLLICLVLLLTLAKFSTGNSTRWARYVSTGSSGPGGV